MIELKKDPITARWVIINDSRDFQFDLDDNPDKGDLCPFCLGNEALVPEPIACYDNRGNRINKYDNKWQVKVIPNNKPILTIEGSILRKAEGIYDERCGSS